MAQMQSTIRKPNQDSRVWLHWLVLVLVVFAVFILIRLVAQHRTVKPPTDNPAATNPSSAPVQFDFYTVLPKMAVSVQSAATPPTNSALVVKAKPISAAVSSPATAPSASTPAIAPSTPKSLPSSMIVLQIAALRQLTDAQRLRDQMHSSGYPAFIQTYQSAQITWYRVMVGPYNSPDSAQKTQDQLKKFGVNSLIIKNRSPLVP